MLRSNILQSVLAIKNEHTNKGKTTQCQLYKCYSTDQWVIFQQNDSFVVWHTPGKFQVI